jgi:hypothetical protein
MSGGPAVGNAICIARVSSNTLLAYGYP